MNRLVLSVLFMLSLTSCVSEYKIEGSSSVSLLDGKMLFVKVPQDGRMVNVDSAEVVHGLFSMEGTADSAVIAALYMDDESIMPLVVEKGKIQIQIDNTHVKVSGTPLNDKLYNFVTNKIRLDDRAYELERMESRMIMDGRTPEEIEDELLKEREKLSNEMNDLAKNFIQENYENVLGPGVFIMLCSSLPYPVMTPLMEEIVEGAPDCFKNHSLIKEYVGVARENTKQADGSR